MAHTRESRNIDIQVHRDDLLNPTSKTAKWRTGILWRILPFKIDELLKYLTACLKCDFVLYATNS